VRSAGRRKAAGGSLAGRRALGRNFTLGVDFFASIFLSIFLSEKLEACYRFCGLRVSSILA
jgi:hypothetical protein